METGNRTYFIKAGVKDLSKHAPVKTKSVRANQDPFINKNLNKMIAHRTSLEIFFSEIGVMKTKLVITTNRIFVFRP